MAANFPSGSCDSANSLRVGLCIGKEHLRVDCVASHLTILAMQNDTVHAADGAIALLRSPGIGRREHSELLHGAATEVLRAYAYLRLARVLVACPPHAVRRLAPVFLAVSGHDQG